MIPESDKPVVIRDLSSGAQDLCFGGERLANAIAVQVLWDDCEKLMRERRDAVMKLDELTTRFGRYLNDDHRSWLDELDVMRLGIVELAEDLKSFADDPDTEEASRMIFRFVNEKLDQIADFLPAEKKSTKIKKRKKAKK